MSGKKTLAESLVQVSENGIADSYLQWFSEGLWKWYSSSLEVFWTDSNPFSTSMSTSVDLSTANPSFITTSCTTYPRVTATSILGPEADTVICRILAVNSSSSQVTTPVPFNLPGGPDGLAGPSESSFFHMMYGKLTTSTTLATVASSSWLLDMEQHVLQISWHSVNLSSCVFW